jgi:hypothetical protein
MADRHKESPQAVRMPGDLKEWYRQHAAGTGQSLNAVLVAALTEYRQRHDPRHKDPAPANPQQGGDAK